MQPRAKRRNKVISIRLSNEEYDQLQRLCVAKGSINMSELAREGMQLLIFQQAGTVHEGIESRVNEINLRMTLLDKEVARLSTLVGVGRLEEAQ